MASIVSLTDARRHLNVKSSDNDDEIADLLDTAEAKVLQLTGPVNAAGTVVELADAYNGVIRLRQAPIASVASVVTSGGILTGWDADLAAGLVYITPYWVTNPVTVTYATADSNVPSALLHTAVLMVLQRLWETQRGSSPTVLQGDDGATFTPGLQGILSEVRALLGTGDKPTLA